MNHSIPVLLAAAVLVTGAATLQAGPTGYASSSSCRSACADSKFQTPRYFQVLPYRHFEDRSRYNAAPCCGEVVSARPYVVKTVVVRKTRVPHVTYDAHGRRHCRKVLTIVYKDIYSDGSCRTWTKSA